MPLSGDYSQWRLYGLVLFTSGNTLSTAAIGTNLLVNQVSEQAESSQAAARYLEQGEKLLLLDFQGAEAAIRKAVQLDPNNAKSHHNLGFVLFLQGFLPGKQEGAIAELRQALRINPNHAETHNNLGNILYRQGKREEAIAELKQARDLFNAQGDAQEAVKVDQFLEQTHE